MYPPGESPTYTTKKSGTAKGGGAGGALNAAFAPEMMNIGTPSMGGNRLKRGKIMSDPSTPAEGAAQGTINFLYNPTSLDLAFQTNENLPSEEAQLSKYMADEGGALGYQGTTSISLLFDRTYEVWRGSKSGAYSDINAFYRMFGISEGNGKTIDSPMRWVHLYVFMGPLTLYGVGKSLETHITQWAVDLTPMRASVTLTIQLLANPSMRAKGGIFYTQQKTAMNGAGTGGSGGGGGGGQATIPGKTNNKPQKDYPGYTSPLPGTHYNPTTGVWEPDK